MERKVVLFGILFKLCLLLSVYVNSENSVNGRLEFKYDFRRHDRSVAFMCLKKNHDCYFYNMTGQERQDVHDQMKIFTIESKILTMVNTAGVFIRGPKTLYDNDLIYFRGFCRNYTMWLMK